MLSVASSLTFCSRGLPRYGLQVRTIGTRAPAQQPVTIAGLLTSGSRKARAKNRAREYAARVTSVLKGPGFAVSAVALANVAVYGAWKAAFWCASSTNSRRSVFGLFHLLHCLFILACSFLSVPLSCSLCDKETRC